MNAPWWLGKYSRRLASRVCRHLYVDGHREMGRSIFIAGTARSGSTWLAEVVASQAPCRMMFEPFHNAKIRELAELEYFQFLRPDEEHPVLEAFCGRIFRGEIRHPWIDREVRVLRPRYRLIKEIRANLFLRWIHEHFPEVRMMLLLRHPAAVVASRLGLGWATDGDLDPILNQPALADEIPFEVLERIRREGSDVEKHAALWSVSYLLPLRQFEPGSIPCVFYENLVADPERELPRVFDAAGLDYDASAFERLRVPSTTTVGHSAIGSGEDRLWAFRKKLTPAQLGEIDGVVDRFGLGALYGTDGMPSTPEPFALLTRP